MQKSGVIGDNIEIQAFAREFGVDVKIYQREHAYVTCADNGSGNAAAENSDGRRLVHIAYHAGSLCPTAVVVRRQERDGNRSDELRPGRFIRRSETGPVLTPVRQKHASGR